MPYPRTARLRTFRHSSVVVAPVEAVWQRVTNFVGINDELMPVMRMRVPRAHRHTTVATVPVGAPLGKAWIFLLGVLPLEYDDLVLTEVEHGSHFQEVSTMLSMRRWEHRRELRPIDAHRTEVRDTVGFEPRARMLGPVLVPALKQMFAHRHHRLARHFAGG